MIKKLKEILIKIANLPKVDQSWILNKLTKTEKSIFNKIEGELLLQKARRFRKLEPSMPSYPSLMNDCPLYSAIILEQGQFSWQTEFLDCFDQENKIKNCLNSNQLKKLKDKTKQSLFSQWKQIEPSAIGEQHHD